MTSKDEVEKFISNSVHNVSLNAQNTCRVHEQCDSSCPKRLQLRQYTVLPSGEKVNEIDPRAELAATTAALSLGGSPGDDTHREEPITIPPDTPNLVYKGMSAPDRAIRLLKVKPAIFRADPVDCELVEFKIDETPAFGALSYCWSTTPPNRPMLCNGAVFTATPSLERALKRLRAGFRPGDREEYLWADAICINQADEDEKSMQIQLMGKIYSTANTVYVDLGDLNGMSYDFEGFKLTVENAFAGMGQQDNLAIWQRHPGVDLAYSTAVVALMMPWFRRTWIIQEVVLAQRVKYLFHGTVFTQEQLDKVIGDEALRGNRKRTSQLHAATDLGYSNYRKIQEIKRLVGIGRRDALNFIYLTRDFLVTQPKDKIWGLAALLTDEDRAALGPYTQSAHDVHRRFAAIFIKPGRMLEVIGFAGLQRRPPNDGSGRIQPVLPTWTPDWTALKMRPKDIANLRPVPYSAYGPLREPHVRLLGDDRGSGGLGVRGIRVDVLARVVTAGAAGERAEDGFLAWHRRARAAFDEWARAGRSPYRDNELAFARLLLMDDTYTGGNAVEGTTPILDPKAAYREALADWRPENEAFQASRKTAAETFRMQAATTCGGRALAFTNMGCIALVPNIAKKGDSVVVFCAGIVPHILRKAKGGYHLVGDAFVHDFMYGQAFYDNPSLTRLQQEFVLL